MKQCVGVLAADDKIAVFRRATELLASSRDFDETMSHTIAAFLPVLGDFGFFDLDVGGSVRRTARTHDDPRIQEILRPTQWIRNERTDMNLCALSTGRPALHPVIDDAWYRAIAVNDGHLAVLRDLAFVSMISVPMRYQGELLGALTLFHGTSGRHYGEDELAFAIDLAALAAPVVAHVRLLEQQRKITEALRTSEERLRVGMDAAALGVWDWDVVADRVTWTERNYDLFGLAPGQFGGKLADFSALVHVDDRERVAAGITAALASGGPFTVEFRTMPRDGRVRWLTTRAEVYRDAAGAPVRMIGASYDITERHELLEQAASANRAKDEFLAMLGHELRNPLAPIVSALQLMEVRDPTVFRRERDVLRRQVEHMVRLVDDLLDIARIARGKIELVRESLDVVEVVEAAIEASRSRLVELVVAERPLLIDGDRVRIAQVIGNLLANATKFSPAGEPITVEITATDSEITLVVTDRGAGIEPDLLPHVFELFVQGSQPLARERGGLGVGLAIVASIVGLHGGRAVAESAGVGQGASFRVTLPRLRVAAVPAVASVPLADGPALRVLVVDDNIDSLDLLGELLRLHGHGVHVADRAQSALDLLATTTVDVALLDLGLPGMTGYELAVEIRKRAPGVRLVAMTGYGLPSDRARTRDAGFEKHLVKPVEAEVVLAALRE